MESKSTIEIRVEVDAEPETTCAAVPSVAPVEAEKTPEVAYDTAHEAEVTRPSVLVPILKIMVQASAIFTPLQSAAGGLLKVIDVVEVRHCYFIYPCYPSPGARLCEIESCSKQGRGGRIEDIVVQARCNAQGLFAEC